ncbi:hypothetical protein AB07_3224 [Citrobacter freundii]|nr:hypothetical protein AB07_3224 [Citrobacter freundii]
MRQPRLFFAWNDCLIFINHYKTVIWRVCDLILIKYNRYDFI